MKSEHKYYVSMTDKVLSGWWPAEGKINKLVFACDDYTQALIVAENAKARTDQARVRICCHKPRYNPSTYYVQYKTIADYPAWYQKGFFASDESKS